MRLVMGRGLCSRLSFAAVRTTASLLLLALCSVLLLASTSAVPRGRHSETEDSATGLSAHDQLMGALGETRPEHGNARSELHAKQQQRARHKKNLSYSAKDSQEDLDSYFDSLQKADAVLSADHRRRDHRRDHHDVKEEEKSAKVSRSARPTEQQHNSAVLEGTPADQLARLAALNSQGILDNTEYLAAKAKVMAQFKKASEGANGVAAGSREDEDAQEEERAKDAAAAAAKVTQIKSEKREAERAEQEARQRAADRWHKSQAAANKFDDEHREASAQHPKNSKVQRHKLMDRDDGNDVIDDTGDANIFDKYNEYVDDDLQTQSSMPPGEQGGELLQPQSKSFFSDVRKEAYKVDAHKEFPKDMLAAMDLDVEPCEDFYEYACGTFLKEAVIPDYLTAMTLTWETAKNNVISETSELLKADASDAGVFYRTCVDEHAVEAQGAKPLTAWFQAIAGVKDIQSLSSFLATAGTYNWFVLKHVALMMPDQKYYIDEGEEMDSHRAAALQAAEQILLAAGASSREEAMRQARIALDIETDVARSMVTKERLQQIHPVRVQREKLKEMSPSVDWDVFFEGMGLPTVGTEVDDDGIGDLYVHDYHYLGNLETNVWSKYSFDDLRVYLIYRTANVYTPYLSSVFTDAKMVLNDELYGMSQRSPRGRKCYYLTVRQFKEATGKIFVDTYFPQLSEDASREMLGNIRGAFEDHLETLTWMDESTREAAVEKLEGMDYQVGYPEGWPGLAKYGSLALTEESFFANIVTVAKAHSKQERDRLYEKPDRDDWSHSATTTNAYYSRNKNALFIPAGILQPPFFSPEFPDCRNYGGIGSVLGHEMTHGFDNSGRKYDATGERTNWWDPETEQEFERRAACLASQFDEFTVSGGHHVNGNLTLGENIADGGGLRMSYKAFLKKHPEASKWEKQMFFLSYAQIWCGVQRPKAAQAHVLKGVHSPKRYRVIGTLRDSEEFAEAFMCKAGDPMNPDDKCVVW